MDLYPSTLLISIGTASGFTKLETGKPGYRLRLGFCLSIARDKVYQEPYTRPVRTVCFYADLPAHNLRVNKRLSSLLKIISATQIRAATNTTAVITTMV
jgi:hypothetical protein